jgi:hypothetical protein
MAYRRFKPSANAFGPATLANPATLRPETASTVAELATVAGQNVENALPRGGAAEPTPSGLHEVSVEEWQAYFDERAGIREFDGGLARADAEMLAAEDTVAALGQRPFRRTRGLS